MSVYVLDVCVEGKSVAEVVYGKDYVCLCCNHHVGAVEGCGGVFNSLTAMASYNMRPLFFELRTSLISFRILSAINV